MTRRNTTALDAKHRSSIYTDLVPLLGEDDADVLMSEFPSVEADELVTKQFLRAELAELRAEFAEAMRRQTAATLGTIAAATAVISTVAALV